MTNPSQPNRRGPLTKEGLAVREAELRASHPVWDARLAMKAICSTQKPVALMSATGSPPRMTAPPDHAALPPALARLVGH